MFPSNTPFRQIADRFFARSTLQIQRHQALQNFVVSTSCEIVCPAASCGHPCIQRGMRIGEPRRAPVVEIGQRALFQRGPLRRAKIGARQDAIRVRVFVHAERSYIRYPRRPLRRMQSPLTQVFQALRGAGDGDGAQLPRLDFLCMQEHGCLESHDPRILVRSFSA